MFKCVECGQELSLLEAFPNDLCVACYARTPEANRPITAQELAEMWGATKRKRARA